MTTLAMELNQPLNVNDIDFRVQSINDWGKATLLAYKDARVDMNRLDKVVGPMNWKREHEFKNNLMYCKVSIFCSERKEWISKEDVGTESKADKDNNQVKGESSDAFKRACFSWGIGRELYDYPVIKIQLNEDEWKKNGKYNNQTWKLQLKKWKWYTEFTDDGVLQVLAAQDETEKRRFTWKAEGVKI